MEREEFDKLSLEEKIEVLHQEALGIVGEVFGSDRSLYSLNQNLFNSSRYTLVSVKSSIWGERVQDTGVSSLDQRLIPLLNTAISKLDEDYNNPWWLNVQKQKNEVIEKLNKLAYPSDEETPTKDDVDASYNKLEAIATTNIENARDKRSTLYQRGVHLGNEARQIKQTHPNSKLAETVYDDMERFTKKINTDSNDIAGEEKQALEGKDSRTRRFTKTVTDLAKLVKQRNE